MATPKIHPRAAIDAHAELGEGVEVGPFAVIERDVQIGAGTRILAGAHIRAHTTLGCENLVRDHAILGGDPQDVSYAGAQTSAIIGDRNIFAEGMTVHRGTAEGSRTVIGSDCFFMANSHVAHDCVVEDHVIFANGALLGGHSSVGERAFISGNVAVHQNVRVGRLAMLSGLGVFTIDVPPFALVSDRNRLRGINSVGLRRSGLSRESMSGLRVAFRDLFKARRNLSRAREELVAGGDLCAEVLELLQFIASAPRGICRVQ